MTSFIAKFPVLQELFAKNHRGARVNIVLTIGVRKNAESFKMHLSG